MPSDKVDVTVSLEVDADEPIADVSYGGTQWASVTFVEGRLEVTIYGEPPSKLPLDDAVGSLLEARDRLLEATAGPD